MEDLAKSCRAPLHNNEDLNIVENEADSGDDVLETDMESFSSLMQSNLNNRPLCYSGDSDPTNRHRRSGIGKASNMIGK